MKIKIFPYLSELLGTFLLILAFLMSESNPAVVGGTVILVMWLGGKLSANINPALTITQFLNGKLDSYTTIGYIASQIAGAILSLYVVKTFA